MAWQGWFTVGLVMVMIVGLVRYAHAADVIFLGAVTLLTLVGIITPEEAVSGFKNEGMLTVAALFVVAAGLVETGFMSMVARWVLGRAATGAAALRRFVPAATVLSAFLNNTTVVAMTIPPLIEWSRRRGVSPSRVLLPLSFAAILGGTCTLIGTSTNLVVHGLMQASGRPELRSGLAMWEIGAVGIPIAIVGSIYLIVMAQRLLPERKEFLEQLGESRREYLAEIIVEPICPLIGQTVQDAGLRGLPGLFLIEIERKGHLVSPVGPDERIEAGDRLVFTGVVSTIVDLQRTPGLIPAADTTYDVNPIARRGRRLCEAVVSSSSPLIGTGIRTANFRTTYDAAVVAVHRNGERLNMKIGDVRLRAGDTLLLETGPGFVRAHRNNPNFYLVSEVGGTSPPRHERAWLAAAIAVGMVVMMTMPELLLWLDAPRPLLNWFDGKSVIFAILAAGLMVVTRCVSAGDARRSIEWSVLIVIAAAFGVGRAMYNSGAAAAISHTAIGALEPWGPIGVLAGVYVMTWILTELMSNNAAAALMFPIALATADRIGADSRAFAVAVAVAASAGFLMPIGYQTHLMVFGPGGYRVTDFTKVGLPMVLIWMVMAITLIPLIWL